MNSVTLNSAGDIMVAGAYLDDDGGTNTGAAFIFGLDPENLKTYCPNAHSGKTMKYEDYMPK